MRRPTIARCVDRPLEAAVGELRKSVEEAGRRSLPGLPAQVARAVLYIHRHAFEPGLNAAAVRAGCGVRNHNLTTLFRDNLGITLRKYIETLRLESAERLLRTVRSEVFLVAAAVGYDHHETFCRAFRRRFGCTPLASRARPEQSREQAKK